MAKKKNEEAPPPGAPAWMATYGDMITLVLTFFVLLFSMSSLDAAKFMAMVANLQGNPYIFEVINNAANIGQTGLEQAPEIPEGDFSDPTDAWLIAAERMRGDIEDWISSSEGEGGTADLEVTIHVTEAQIVIRCKSSVLFDTLSDVLLPRGIEALAFIVEDLILPDWETGIISEVFVEGHADIRPIPPNNRFADNDILAAYRARAARRFIVDNYSIPENKIGMTSWGDTRPVDGNPGTDETQWSVNRRVEFVLHRNFFLDEQTGAGYGEDL
ncbi:MAG: OmpA family protein [Oscillospiraceae bacterium]|nr:OmpA family protein [Oscillospiraceae bacterium]